MADMEETATKIAKLETRTEFMGSEISEVKGLVKEAIVKIDNFSSFQVDLQGLKDEIARLKEEIFALKKSAFLWRFLAPTLSAACGAILYILVASYIQHLGGG